jgi:hypothetical protein
MMKCHEVVYYWQDMYFNQYLANNRWGCRVLHKRDNMSLDVRMHRIYHISYG